MNKFIKFIFIFAFIFSYFGVKTTFAAHLYFEAYKNDSSSGGYILNAVIDADNELLNAVEGNIIFPDSIEIKDINDGNSVINFWIEKPNTKKGTVSFSGITPGGFSGQKRVIFSVSVSEGADSKGEISFDSIKILKNDGTGSEAKVMLIPLKLPIKTTLLVSDLKGKEHKDVSPPEDFTPSIVKNKDILNEQTLLVFATQDKESGINHYEVREGIFGKYIVAESPYILKKQSGDTKVFVKAIDNAGNERVVEYYPPEYVVWYRQYGLIAIILVIVILISIRKKWSKFIK